MGAAKAAPWEVEMIGTHHKGYKVIAALPVNGGEPGHMIVVGQQLRLPGKGHHARFVTCFTDSQGVFDSPVYFTDHAKPAGWLRNRAIGDMIRRAGHMLTALS